MIIIKRKTRHSVADVSLRWYYLLLPGCLSSLGLTVLGVVEGPCQRFTGGVVAATHAALVVSGLGVEDVVAARLLRRHNPFAITNDWLLQASFCLKMMYGFYLWTQLLSKVNEVSVTTVTSWNL